MSIQQPDYQDIDQNPIPVEEKPAPEPFLPGMDEDEEDELEEIDEDDDLDEFDPLFDDDDDEDDDED